MIKKINSSLVEAHKNEVKNKLATSYNVKFCILHKSGQNMKFKIEGVKIFQLLLENIQEVILGW